MTKKKKQKPPKSIPITLWNGHHSAIEFEFLWGWKFTTSGKTNISAFERYLNNGDIEQYLSK